MNVKMLIVFALFTLTTLAQAAANYPIRPDSRLTRGSLCNRPVEYRYLERIPYCGRDVSTEMKNDVFVSYRQIGYTLNSANRADYKIDHYIPLCLGGSNYQDNLWPQHVSIYSITDSLEALTCEKLKQNRINHATAVRLLLTVKNDLSQARNVTNYLHSL
jgi:hypothetical protein